MADSQRAALDGVHTRLPWPRSPDGPSVDPFTHRTFALPEDVADGVLSRSRTARVVPFAIPLAAMALVVAPDDMGGRSRPYAVSSLFANRATAAEASIVGWIAQRVPIRLPHEGGTVEQWIRAAHREVMASLGTQQAAAEFDDEEDGIGLTASLMYLSGQLSGAEQADMRLGTAQARRLAVSFCPTGADVDLFVVEGAAMLSGGAARLSVGGMALRDRVGADQLDRLLRRWTETLAWLAEADWNSRATPDAPRRAVAAR
jgi:hypothetical protein